MTRKRPTQVAAIEDLVDKYEDHLGTYMVKVGSQQLSKNDSHTVSLLLHCIGDFERISDHAMNLMTAAKEMHDKNMEFSKKAEEELKVFLNAVTRDPGSFCYGLREQRCKEGFPGGAA